MHTVAVVIQTCAPERSRWDFIKESIESSDIQTRYELCFHPPGVSIGEHLCECLRRGAATGADLVLRLEDDVEVNRFIVHNVANWPAVDDERFGLGWAFDPAAQTGVSKRSTRERYDAWRAETLWYSQAVVMRSADAERIIDGCRRYYRNRPGITGEQDLALSYAALSMGKELCIHAPSLVEHRIELASVLQHRHIPGDATSRGSFDKDWRRGPVYDRYGREVTVWP